MLFLRKVENAFNNQYYYMQAIVNYNLKSKTIDGNNKYNVITYE